MSSISRFDSGLIEVELLLAADPTRTANLPPGHPPSNSIPTNEPDEVELGATLRRAAIVLLVSHFEGYLKQMCEDLADALNTGRIQARHIPSGIRELHVLPRLRDVVNTTDDKQRNALIKKLGDLSSLWNDRAKPPSGTIRADLVAGQVHNADSKCIDDVFRLFGERRNVCDGAIDVRRDNDGDIEETHDIRIRLRDVVKCRNDIAHGELERRPTMDDARRYVDFLRAFANRLDRKKIEIVDQISSNTEST